MIKEILVLSRALHEYVIQKFVQNEGHVSQLFAPYIIAMLQSTLQTQK